MNILLICHRIPYPPNKGDKVRSLHILRILKKRARVHLACLVDHPADLARTAALAREADTLLFDFMDPRLRPLQALKGIFTGRPASLPCFYSRRLQREINSLLRREPFDAAICVGSPTAEYLFRLPDDIPQPPVRIMDLVDVDSEKWGEFRRNTGGPMRWIYLREHRLLGAYEKRIAAEFDRITLVSPAESALFSGLAKTGRISPLVNGVDLDFFHPDHKPAPAGLPEDAAPLIVFTGAMDYRPNADGAIWFVENVLPALRQEWPRLEFCAAGGRPGEELRCLADRPGVTVTGFVDDMRDYIGGADVVVAPLFTARGIQCKVLEAMSMGKAVVTTSRGLEGIAARTGTELLTADDAAGFVRHVSRLLRSPEERAAMGGAARRRMEESYDWSANLGALIDMLEGRA